MNSRKNMVSGFIAVIAMAGIVRAASFTPGLKRRLTVTMEAPPAVFAIVNSQGNTTGFDFSQSVRADGFPVSPSAALVSEIANSHSDFQNIEDDEPGSSGGKETTGWIVEISELGGTEKSNFVIRVKGVRDGVAQARITLTERESGKKTAIYPVDFITTVGRDQVVTGTINVVNGTPPKISKEISNTSLVDDIHILCATNSIDSNSVCYALQKMAEVCTQFLKTGDCEKARNLLDIFEEIIRRLHNPKGDLDWGKFRKDPKHLNYDKECSPFFVFKKRRDYVPSPAFEALLADISALRAGCVSSSEQENDKDRHDKEDNFGRNGGNDHNDEHGHHDK